MKGILLVAAAAILLSAAVVGGECNANDADVRSEYAKCELIKPVDAVEGDEIIINCTKLVKATRETMPVDVTLSIVGYIDGEPMEGISGARTNSDGTYAFKPRLAGTYLIQAPSCNLNAWLEVGEREIVEENLALEALGEGVNETDEPANQSDGESGDSEQDSGDSEAADAADGGEEDAGERTFNGLFGLVMNGGGEDGEEGEEIPGMVLAVVNFMIS